VTNTAMIMHIHCIHWWKNVQWNARFVWYNHYNHCTKLYLQFVCYHIMYQCQKCKSWL